MPCAILTLYTYRFTLQNERISLYRGHQLSFLRGNKFLSVEKKKQLDATAWFIALIICSTCFGHLYDHHQELETIRLLLPHMVCDAMVAGGRLSEAEQKAMGPG